MTSRTPTRGAEEARAQLPTLLEAAARGEPTVITRHGKPIAALAPLEALARATVQTPATALRGSGFGLWGEDPAAAIAALRDEWSR